MMTRVYGTKLMPCFVPFAGYQKMKNTLNKKVAQILQRRLFKVVVLKAGM